MQTTQTHRSTATPADAGPAPLLHARDLAKAYGNEPVFDGVCLDVAPGQRLGLVGENGAGKSTLLRLLAGIEDPDGGAVARPSDTGFLHQEVPYPGRMSLAEVVEEALAPSRAVEDRLARLAADMNDRPGDTAVFAAYAEALERAEAQEVWDADRRAGLVLAGLGLDALEPGRRLAEMSGGQRTRLGLAALLIRRPRALLLDEPTNHLDDAAVEFLERYLRGMPGAVVVTSHDRLFLDEVCTGILDLDPSRSGPTYYGGAYTFYLREKRVERERWEQQHRAEQEELRRLRRSVHSTARKVGQFRPMKDGNKMDYDGMGEAVQKQISRRVRNAERRLTELERDQVAKPPRPLGFDSALTGESAAGGNALIARGIEVPGRLALDHLDLPADGRLLVTGPNGAGKSTLLQVLARRIAPARGSVQWRRGTTAALLEQDVHYQRPDLTPRRYYAAMTAGRTGVPPLGELGLVAERDVDRPVGQLSVGQRRRLALALLVGNAPNVLLLDEPTNHISLRLAGELEEALGSAPGAVVVASHDRWLRRGWDGPELRLDGGRVRERITAR
ncbi:macrolide transport system ATP-binding/permease protein [Nocardiopsis mwathae]|uniref:Macrolide transport system ATP-binding/permease protein n=1 Tax=Nocardiopsis mwathae TaxID=1472723 RepID=A0A7X0D543_9ACTN|nr:ABC-F family ATP-binding cassette domain-containing protein [Nocardiopsis mwathae]MBB6171992.1 macrolide transport system ATP-binding/permease protein [Nocardiopsis mwathae]